MFYKMRSLKEGKLISLNGDKNGNIYTSNKNVFRLGSYLSCDYVLGNPQAKGVHCEISCDAFGRIKITNLSKNNPIFLNGKVLRSAARLLSGTCIKIFEEEFRWEHKTVSRKSESLDEPKTPNTSPQYTSEVSNSAPNLREQRTKIAPRKTVHNLLFQPGKRSFSSDSLNYTSTKRQAENSEDCEENISLSELCPQTNSASKIKLSMCKTSDLVITSYSPNLEGSNPNRSFANVISKNESFNSLYTTPEQISVSDSSIEIVDSNASVKRVANNISSTYLIDLLTPKKNTPRTGTPLLRSALKNSTKKAINAFKPSRTMPEQNFPNTPLSCRKSISFKEEAIRKSASLKKSTRSVTDRSLRSKSATRTNSVKKVTESNKSCKVLNYSQPSPKSVKSIEQRANDAAKLKLKKSTTIESEPHNRNTPKSVRRNFTTMATSTPLITKSDINGGGNTTQEKNVSKAKSSGINQNAKAGSIVVKKHCCLNATEPTCPAKPINSASKPKPGFSGNSFMSALRKATAMRNAEIQNFRKEFMEATGGLPVNEQGSLAEEKNEDTNKKEEIKNNSTFSVSSQEENLDDSKADKDQVDVNLSSDKPNEDSILDEKTTQKGINQALESLLKTPNACLRKSGNLSGLTKLFQTPKEEKTLEISGIQELMTTPESFSLKKQTSLMDPGTSLIANKTLNQDTTVFKSSASKDVMIHNEIEIEDEESLKLSDNCREPENIHDINEGVVVECEILGLTPIKYLTTEEEGSEKYINDVNEVIPVNEGEGDISADDLFDQLVKVPHIKHDYSRISKSTGVFPLPVSEESVVQVIEKPDIIKWLNEVNKNEDAYEMGCSVLSDKENIVQPLFVSHTTTLNVSRNTLGKSIENESAIILSSQSTNEEFKICADKPLRRTLDGTGNRKESPDDCLQEECVSFDNENVSLNRKEDNLSKSKSFILSICDDEDMSTSHERDYNQSVKVFDQNGIFTSQIECETKENISFKTRRTPNRKSIRKNQNSLSFVEASKKNNESKLKQLRRRTTGRYPLSEIPLENILNIKGNISLLDEQAKTQKTELNELSSGKTSKEVLSLESNSMSQNDLQTTDVGGDESIDVNNDKGQFKDTEELFENFESIPNLGAIRGKSQSPEKNVGKAGKSRKTLGQQPDSQHLDVEQLKAEREKEILFENFTEKPEFIKRSKRISELPKPEKKLRTNRKTVGFIRNNDMEDIDFDWKAVKDQKELEDAFKNFDHISELKTIRSKSESPEAKPVREKSRRTLGNRILKELPHLDLEKAKSEYEREVIFKNFSEEPSKSANYKRKSEIGSLDTKPEKRTKYLRKTMGVVVDKVDFDLKAEKERKEMEDAFKNFEAEPNTRSFRGRSQSPEEILRKESKNRRTLGQPSIGDSLDIEALKAARETEILFANFSENPSIQLNKARKSVGHHDCKRNARNTRRTMYTMEEGNVTFDWEEAKAQRESEILFKNFKEQPSFKNIRGKTMSPRQIKQIDTKKDRSFGHAPLSDSFNVEDAKAKYDQQVLFENFSEEPSRNNDTTRKSIACVPAITTKPNSRRTLRKTVVENLTTEPFNWEEAKQEKEIRDTFENFETHPIVYRSRCKSLSPDTTKLAIKSRRTVGRPPISSSFDVKEAKALYEKELLFENFSEEPRTSLSLKRKSNVLPENFETKPTVRKYRRTMGLAPLSNTFNVSKAKQDYEKQILFENFSEVPVQHALQKRKSDRINDRKPTQFSRKTMGNQVENVSFDWETAKIQKDLENDFNNFEEAPKRKILRSKSIGPVQKQNVAKSRKTVGHLPIQSELSTQDIGLTRTKPNELHKNEIEVEVNAQNNYSLQGCDFKSRISGSITQSAKKLKQNSSLTGEGNFYGSPNISNINHSSQEKSGTATLFGQSSTKNTSTPKTSNKEGLYESSTRECHVTNITKEGIAPVKQDTNLTSNNVVDTQSIVPQSPRRSTRKHGATDKKILCTETNQYSNSYSENENIIIVPATPTSEFKIPDSPARSTRSKRRLLAPSKLLDYQQSPKASGMLSTSKTELSKNLDDFGDKCISLQDNSKTDSAVDGKHVSVSLFSELDINNSSVMADSVKDEINNVKTTRSTRARTKKEAVKPVIERNLRRKGLKNESAEVNSSENAENSLNKTDNLETSKAGIARPRRNANKRNVVDNNHDVPEVTLNVTHSREVEHSTEQKSVVDNTESKKPKRRGRPKKQELMNQIEIKEEVTESKPLDSEQVNELITTTSEEIHENSSRTRKANTRSGKEPIKRGNSRRKPIKDTTNPDIDAEIEKHQTLLDEVDIKEENKVTTLDENAINESEIHLPKRELRATTRRNLRSRAKSNEKSLLVNNGNTDDRELKDEETTVQKTVSTKKNQKTTKPKKEEIDSTSLKAQSNISKTLDQKSAMSSIELQQAMQNQVQISLVEIETVQSQTRETQMETQQEKAKTSRRQKQTVAVAADDVNDETLNTRNVRSRRQKKISPKDMPTDQIVKISDEDIESEETDKKPTSRRRAKNSREESAASAFENKTQDISVELPATTLREINDSKKVKKPRSNKNQEKNDIIEMQVTTGGEQDQENLSKNREEKPKTKSHKSRVNQLPEETNATKEGAAQVTQRVTRSSRRNQAVK